MVKYNIQKLVALENNRSGSQKNKWDGKSYKVLMISHIVLFLALIMSGCEDNPTGPDIDESDPKGVCISVSGLRVRVDSFWSNGDSQSTTLVGESGFTQIVSRGSESITMNASNISYSGNTVSAITLRLQGGPHYNDTYRYPADSCH